MKLFSSFFFTTFFAFFLGTGFLAFFLAAAAFFFCSAFLAKLISYFSGSSSSKADYI